MRGAVDLSVLRERPSPSPAVAKGNGAGPARPTPPGPGGVTIIDVTEATFQSEVVERSMSTPVVVDFWADWCTPCKQLAPVLEKLAVEGGGSWVLARVNVDENPRLAHALRVQGIPMVYAIVGAQPVDVFAGVRSEAQLREWISNVVLAGSAAAPPPEDPGLVAAEEALLAGDLDEAERAYKKVLAQSPADEVAAAGVAQVGLLRRVQGVDAQAVLAQAAAAPDDIDAQTLAADVELLAGQAEAAYTRLIDLVRRTSGADRDRVRTHLLSLFTLAGRDDPTVAAARRALASALF